MDKLGIRIDEKIFKSRFGQEGSSGRGFADLVSIVLSNAIVIAGIILLFLLVFGGISMIVGAGQSNPEKTAQGKKAATSAIVGFAIIFTTYWIIEIVGKIAGFNILNPPIP